MILLLKQINNEHFFEAYHLKKSFSPKKVHFFGQNFPKYRIPGYPGITPRVLVPENGPVYPGTIP